MAILRIAHELATHWSYRSAERHPGVAARPATVGAPGHTPLEPEVEAEPEPAGESAEPEASSAAGSSGPWGLLDAAALKAAAQPHWEAVIAGDEGSVYAGGTFLLTVTFPPGYPYDPPELCFVTGVFHPRFLPNQPVELPRDWTPDCTLEQLLLDLQELLRCPSAGPSCPNAEAAALLEADRAAYDERARAHTARDASEPAPAWADLVPRTHEEVRPGAHCLSSLAPPLPLPCLSTVASGMLVHLRHVALSWRVGTCRLNSRSRPPDSEQRAASSEPPRSPPPCSEQRPQQWPRASASRAVGGTAESGSSSRIHSPQCRG